MMNRIETEVEAHVEFHARVVEGGKAAFVGRELLGVGLGGREDERQHHQGHAHAGRDGDKQQNGEVLEEESVHRTLFLSLGTAAEWHRFGKRSTDTARDEIGEEFSPISQVQYHMRRKARNAGVRARSELGKKGRFAGLSGGNGGSDGARTRDLTA